MTTKYVTIDELLLLMKRKQYVSHELRGEPNTLHGKDKNQSVGIDILKESAVHALTHLKSTSSRIMVMVIESENVDKQGEIHSGASMLDNDKIQVDQDHCYPTMVRNQWERFTISVLRRTHDKETLTTRRTLREEESGK